MQFERSHVSPGVCSQVKFPLFAAAARNVSLQQGIVTDRGTFWWGRGLKCQICKGEKGKMHNGACADARPTGGASLHRCRGFYCSPCVVANYSLKWNCSYSHMKPGAQIRHKSHSFSFCPFNHFQVWVPHFCVLSKHACNIFFFFPPFPFPRRCERNSRTWSCLGSFIAFQIVQIEHMFLGRNSISTRHLFDSGELKRLLAPALHIIHFLMQIGMNK